MFSSFIIWHLLYAWFFILQFTKIAWFYVGWVLSQLRIWSGHGAQLDPIHYLYSPIIFSPIFVPIPLSFYHYSLQRPPPHNKVPLSSSIFLTTILSYSLKQLAFFIPLFWIYSTLLLCLCLRSYFNNILILTTIEKSLVGSSLMW